VGYFQSHHSEVKDICEDILICRSASRFDRVDPRKAKNLVRLSYLHREKWTAIDIEMPTPDLIVKRELFAAKKSGVFRIAPKAYFFENFSYRGISRIFMRFDFPTWKIPNSTVLGPLLDREKSKAWPENQDARERVHRCIPAAEIASRSF
jgi:hypothetical protein